MKRASFRSLPLLSIGIAIFSWCLVPISYGEFRNPPPPGMNPKEKPEMDQENMN